MRPLTHIPRYTITDYRHWEGHWELIDGIPYAMSPSPIIRHQELAGALYSQILVSIKNQRGKCGDCRVLYEIDWIVDDTTVLRPDITIICKNTGDFITSPPVLIIEILSPSTALKDRQVKFEIYQEQGVKYYILADPGTKGYNIFKLIDKQYQEETNISSFVIHENCGVQIDLAQALAEL